MDEYGQKHMSTVKHTPKQLVKPVAVLCRGQAVFIKKECELKVVTVSGLELQADPRGSKLSGLETRCVNL